MPKPVRTKVARSASPTGRSLKRIVREGDDFRFVFVNPSHAFVKRYFVLSVAVGDVDRQPIRSTLSKRLAVCKFKQGSAAIVRLSVDQLRHRVSTAPMVQLMRKIKSRFVEQALTQRQKVMIFRVPLIRLFRMKAAARSRLRSVICLGSASSANRGGSCPTVCAGNPKNRWPSSHAFR